MKNWFIILIILCSNIQLVKAQHYFNQLDTIGFGYVQILQEDSNYYIVGELYNTGGSRANSITKSDSFGKVLWTDTISQYPKLTSGGRLISTESEYLFCTMINLDTPYVSANRDILLRKYDKNWNIVFEKILGGIDQDVPTDFKSCSDGGYVISGVTGSFGDSLGDFYLIKIDSLGVVEWEKNYGGNKTDVINSVAITSDGGYIFSGYSGSYSSSTDCIVLKVDSAGNQQWVKNFGMNFSDNGGMITELNDKSYLVSTAFRSSFFQSDATILKLDSVGSIIWQKTYPQSDYSALNIPITENTDGTIIVGGIVKNIQNTPVARIIKIDPIGNEIWSKVYEERSDRDQYILDIKATSDGGYVFCGSAWDSIKQRAWIVKLDCFGCDSLLCYYEDSICEPFVSLTEIQSSMQEPRLYPNPNSGIFTLNLNNIPLKEAQTGIIYDLNGRIVWQEAIFDSLEFTTTLPKGMYFFELPELRWLSKMVIE